jgi:hypothetical protein
MVKNTLWATTAVLGLFSIAHVLIAIGHALQTGPDRESVLAPVVTAVVSGGVALWTMRQARRASGPPTERPS